MVKTSGLERLMQTLSGSSSEQNVRKLSKTTPKLQPIIVPNIPDKKETDDLDYYAKTNQTQYEINPSRWVPGGWKVQAAGTL